MEMTTQPTQRWGVAARTAHATATILYAAGLYLYMIFFWPPAILLGPIWRLGRRRTSSSLESAGPVPEPTVILEQLGGAPRSFMGTDALNTAVCKILKRQVAEGNQLGICVAAYHYGRLVCSCAAGVMRPIDGSGPWQPVKEDTLFLCNSLTKGVTATAFMQLVDEGVIDIDEPVSSVWPEFAAKSNDLCLSKEKVTIADAVSHRAGLVDLGPAGIWACLRSLVVWYRTRSWRTSWDMMVRRIEVC